MITETAGRLLPAGFGRGRRTNTIALIETSTSRRGRLPDYLELLDRDERMDPWTRTALEGFAYAAEWCSFNLIVRYWRVEDEAEQLAASLFPDLADGAIVHAPRVEHLALVPVLAEMGVPCVLAFSRSPDPCVPWVVSDNHAGGRLAVRHLAGLGHRRIAFLTGPEGNLDFQLKLEGYREGMAEAQLEADPELVIRLATQLPSHGELKPTVARLRARPDRPTAVVCVSDTLAHRLIEGAWDIGLEVPRDLAVVAFDDVEEGVSGLLPLTVVRQPVGAAARVATYLAACAVAGQQPDTLGWQVQLPVSLIVRESCGARSPEKPASLREMERQLHTLRATNEEMSQLLHATAHDLRSPLVTIEGFAASLERNGAALLDGKGRDYIARIRGTTRNMQGLVGTLMALCEGSSRPLELRPTSVGEVVNRVAADLEGLIAEHGAQVKISSLLPTVLADPTALYQVFSNLIANAVKFMGDQPRPSVFVGSDTRGSECEFYVRDNGIGIPPDKQGAIFQPFRRLREVEVEGTGIGLTLVKSIVTRHGGRIWVESDHGAGTTFRFTLPRA